jgi:hypothetical protein
VTGEPAVLPAATRRPQQQTPPRRRGSVRRSSHIGVRWSDATADSSSELLVHGAVQDAVTDADGIGQVADAATVDCGIGPDRTVTFITADPDEPRLRTLVGHGARNGWRAAARGIVGADSLLGTVLDDVPIAVMLSSYGALRQGSLDVTSVRPLMLHMRDLCAGWAHDATPMRRLDAGDEMALPGVVLAPVDQQTDPLAAEARPPMVAGEVRRARRLDVTPGKRVRIDATFRDTWRDPGGREGILHEYVLTAALDGYGVVASIHAEPRVLPYRECSLAAASSQQLVGRHIEEVADAVRAAAGTSTCTHLDDLLRSLVAVPALVTSFSVGGYGRAPRPGADD